MLDYKIFGCKTNKYYTDEWLSSVYLQEKNGIFIASCVVTDRAKAKWLKFALKTLKHLKTDEKLYLSGCGTMQGGEIDPKFYEIYPELIDYRDRIELLPEDPRESRQNGKEFQLSQMNSKIAHLKSKITGSKDRRFARKFIVVQMGCNNYCTFCLTLQARGRHRWRSSDEIIEEIRQFVEAGGEEIVLTGTNIGAWGSDDSNDYQSGMLPDLVHIILKKTKIAKVRISSLGVEFINDEMIKIFGEERVTPYAHLSVQSGSDTILKSMNRHYDRPTLLRALKNIREITRADGLHVQIGADLIVGFPGENNADFEDTLSLVTDYGISQVHGFPFSPHQSQHSVPAGKFSDQIHESIKQERLNRLIKAGHESKKQFGIAHDGKKTTLLIEGEPERNSFQGYTANYLWATHENFNPINPDQKLERGKYIEGIYSYVEDLEESSAEQENLGF